MNKRRPRIYELFRTFEGFTERSIWYGRVNKTIWRVRAYSLKQALALCYNRVRSVGTEVGIVEVVK